jgi:4-hydroxyphenylpyruvate dioxygenase
LNSPGGALTIQGVAHIEFYVGNAYQSAQFLRSVLGFGLAGYRGPETGTRDSASYLLRQGDIRFVVTGALTPDHEVARHVLEHGDGVRDVAFQVDDAVDAYELALARGAEPHQDPVDHEDPDGKTTTAAIKTYGDVVHSLVSGTAALPSGYQPLDEDIARGVGCSLVDHVVGNVPLGEMHRWSEFYQRVFGLRVFQMLDEEKFSGEYSASNSQVLWDGVGELRININEPAQGKRQSQIDEYLVAYRGPGVQHIALRTEDVVGTVTELHRRGLETIHIPDSYYEGLAGRFPGLDVDFDAVRRERLLVDQDAHGQLLQTFSRMMQDRPTLFLEFIERRGALGFGEGNAKALFSALEKEQAGRGNL